jgi:hypothetical protein
MRTRPPEVIDDAELAPAEYTELFRAPFDAGDPAVR